MKKSLTQSIILFIVLLMSSGSEALEVRMSGDQLSLEAEQVPLQHILGRLTNLGVRVRIDPQINPNITASFEERDIQRALNSILKSLNHVLVWETIEGPSGPIPKLAEIQVFKPGKKALMKSLGIGSNLSIIRDPQKGFLWIQLPLPLFSLFSPNDFFPFFQLQNFG